MSLEEPLRIQDYAIIGDCRGAALIGRNGSLDWLCWPRFDSPAIFAALLDPVRGGHWQISSSLPARNSRRYVGETNVLETRFEVPGGVAVLTDVMPVASEEYKRRTITPGHEVLRQAECVSGETQITTPRHESPARSRVCWRRNEYCVVRSAAVKVSCPAG